MIEPEAQPEAEWYEPWRPHVGERVRLRPSGECPLQHSVAARLDGECGHVAEIDRSLEYGHFYRVVIDHPELYPELWMSVCGPWCAALELEPVG